MKSASSSVNCDPIRHHSDKCIHPLGGKPNSPPGTMIVTYDECNEKRLEFCYLPDGIIRHTTSGLCVVPHQRRAQAGDSEILVLHNDCGEPHASWRFLPTGSIQHNASGKCWHPMHGGANPANDDPVIVYDGCNEARLNFGKGLHDPPPQG